MPPTRRVWDSVVIIDFLDGKERANPHCPAIIEEAERGETEIIVSVFAQIEVVKIDSALTEEEERMIREFFGRPYILAAALDPFVAQTAREIIRASTASANIRSVKPKDAVHVATALRWEVPVFESYDDVLMDGIKAHPEILPGGASLTLRHPTYEGQSRDEELLRQAEAGGGTPPA